MKAEDITMYKQTLAMNQQSIMWFKGTIEATRTKADSEENRTYVAFLRHKIRQMQAEIKWLQANVPGINY